MKFTATPEALLGLLDTVTIGMTKLRRSKTRLTVSVSKDRITVIGPGASAGVASQVSGRGQFSVNCKWFADLLSTYPPKSSLQMECFASRLDIGSFSTPVENYQSEPVPATQPLPPVKPGKREKAAEAGAVKSPATAGFATPPPPLENGDSTGKAGTVSADDFAGAREPVTCPVCQSVGYHEKHIINGHVHYFGRHTWVSARDASAKVVLTGKEESVLCPKCLDQRNHGARFDGGVAGIQGDFFDGDGNNPLK